MRTLSIVGIGFSLGLASTCSSQDTATAIRATEARDARAGAVSASRPALGNEPPVRIVPQLRWDARGLVHPKGRFAVARAGLFLGGLHVVDMQRRQLAWSIEPWPPGPAGFAFSSDGMRLAICSFDGGQMINLAADEAKMAPWLKGLVLVFSLNDKLVYVAASAKEPQWPWRYVDVIHVYDLHGNMMKSYPLQMNMVGRLSFSNNGQTLVVDGGTGIGLETRSRGTFTPSRQTIELATGTSMNLEVPEAGKRPAFDTADFDAMNFNEIPVSKTTLAQQLTNVLCDAATSSLVVIGRGQPEGGAVKLWNLKESTFSKTVGKSNGLRNVALQRPGLVVGTARHDRKALPPELAAMPTPEDPHGEGALNLVTLVQLPKGTPQPLAIPSRDWTWCQPSPDGRYLAGLIGQSIQDFTFRLQIWDTKRSAMVGEISNPKRPIYGVRWSSDSRFVIVQLPDQGWRVRWEFFTPQGRSDGVVPVTPGERTSFSPNGDLVAVQTKGRQADAWTDTCWTRVRKSRSGEEVATIEGEILDAEPLFVDEQRLLVAGGRAGDSIRLVRISDQKVLWETKAAGEVQSLSWEPGWTNVVVRYRGTCGGADVLSVKDGQRLPATAEGPTWHNPTLIHSGQLALDPLCDSTVLRLKKTVTGRTVVTLAAFADPEWIIYTPEGTWTGSPKALDWVAFYRGAEAVTAEEIAALRDPEAVKTRLAEALR